MITRLKTIVRANLVPWVLTTVAVSLLVLPIVPVASNSVFSQWLIPTASAQTNAVGIIKDLAQRAGLYRPPQRGTAPTGRRSGGAGRGPICALLENDQGSKSVKALVSFGFVNPKVDRQEANNSSTDEFVGGLTVRAQPTFWFYVPYVLNSELASPQKRVAQFVVLDETDRPLGNELIAFELSDQPQLIEYQLPYGLEAEKLYGWYFSVICDAEKLSRNPVVRGWVQRVEPTSELLAQLSRVPASEQYQVYAEAEEPIWLDAISSLMDHRQSPGANQVDWSALLTHFGISDADQLVLVEPAELIYREEVNGNQLPARI
jgi:hypothetical protein